MLGVLDAETAWETQCVFWLGRRCWQLYTRSVCCWCNVERFPLLEGCRNSCQKAKEAANDPNRDQVFLDDSGSSQNVIKICICMRIYIGAVTKKAIKIMSLLLDVPRNSRNFNKKVVSPWDKICDTFFCEKGFWTGRSLISWCLLWTQH